MTNKIFKKTLVFSITLFFASSVYAGPSADILSTCLANSTTGKDRINLARWVFAAMATHPEVASISNVTPEKLDGINKTNGELYTRLLTVDCNKEVREAVKLENSEALRVAFESLGRLAMQELMGNPVVNAQFTSGQEKYLDMKKIKASLE
jgi:23S rRNA C2498 (ribose-2'-O)-methylase RlmM